MQSHAYKKLQQAISKILLAGIFLSTLLVLTGGTVYLAQHGLEPMHYDLLQADASVISIAFLWQANTWLSPVGWIEAGLLVLVLTQILRVALLAYFYIVTHDKPFTYISGIILLVLVYSFIWRN